MAKGKIGILIVFGITLCAGLYGQSLREKVHTSYLSQVGVREATGHNDGKAVEKYLSSCGLGKGYAWCAAFVNWNLVSCGVTTVNSPAWSPSWFSSSRLIYSQKKEMEKPLPGDVFGIWFSRKKRVAHVGFIESWGYRYVITVEGNTNSAGSREGDGVYIKRRLKSQIYQVSRYINQ